MPAPRTKVCRHCDARVSWVWLGDQGENVCDPCWRRLGRASWKSEGGADDPFHGFDNDYSNVKKETK